MKFVSHYVAKKPDKHGFVTYSEEDQEVWRLLYTRQIKIILNRAADEYILGLSKLNFNEAAIPQIPDVNGILQSLTGWQVAPVEALISAREFFELLANKRFPCATFIRHLDSLDYVTEPDIFHELFGHCPLLTEPLFANFMHQYAQQVLTFPEADWPLLQRLFWFTVEFGLIDTPKGLRVYGGGILSSSNETAYSLESHVPIRVHFDPVATFRTPFRIDQLQTVYFVIRNYQELVNMLNVNLGDLMKEARRLGEFPPMFQVDDDHDPNVQIHAC